jgi:hypothetical protein
MILVAARRCSTCARNWSLAEIACPTCGGELWHTEDHDPDTAGDDGEMAARLTDQQSDLWRYRVRRFRELGFTRPQCIRLADEGTDWHQASDLVRRGCPVDIVFDLLSS